MVPAGGSDETAIWEMPVNTPDGLFAKLRLYKEETYPPRSWEVDNDLDLIA